MPIGKTGALPSPRHKLAGMEPYKAAAAPAQWGIVAPSYKMWGNDEFGVCVTSEEAANIANVTAAMGIPQHVLANLTVTAWAKRHGVLNGATLTEVMDDLQQAKRDGLIDQGAAHFVGPYQPVDWEDRAALCGAIYQAQGNVKIGIASACLGEAVQGQNGWMVLTCKKSRALDHCVGLCGYGPLAYLCGLCGVPLPGGVDPSIFCYLLYTWGCVGIVSEAALWNMTGEAWVRIPASIAVPPYGPPVPPVPPIPPVPPTPGPSPCWAIFKHVIAILDLLLQRRYRP